MKHLVALISLLLIAPVACGNGGKTQNTPPVVEVAGPSEVVVGERATLQATATDPEGAALTFAWSLTRAPDGSQLQATVEASSTATLSVAPDLAGAYTFTVTVDDQSGTATSTGTASFDLTAIPPPTIDGSLRVKVVAAEDGAAIAGVQVIVEGTALEATTDASGMATITDPTLVGPITLSAFDPSTISVDHDLDPLTAPIERPARRGATLQGINRPDLILPLRPSGSTRQMAARGVVRGTIDLSLFDRMPTIDPLLSFDMAETTSSQIRAVLIAPLVQGDPADFGVRDLLGRPPGPGAPLPGNLTTDDPFLNGAAPLLGVPGNGGPDPLLDFTVDAPAGRTRFFVLGVLVDIDAVALTPLLGGGGNVDSAALFGSMAFTTLFVGTLDLDVAEGDNDLLTPITDTDLASLAMVPATITFEDSTGPWALAPSNQVSLRKARVAADSVARLTAPPPLKDPRLAEHLPPSARVEITNADGSSKTPKEYTDLAVPADTGPPSTDLPYALAVAVIRDEAGLLPIGFTFTRVADLERPEATFPMPAFEAALASAPLEALILTTRGMWPSAVDGAYELLPGLHTSRVPLTAGTITAAPTPEAFPRLESALDAGLRVRVKAERNDTSSTLVDSSRAYLSFLTEPTVPWNTPLLVGALAEPGSGTLAHATVALRTWTQVDDGKGGLTWTPIDDALWDHYVTQTNETGTPGQQVVPFLAIGTQAVFASGDELRITLRMEHYASPLDLERWSGERLREGPTETTGDAFLFYVP